MTTLPPSLAALQLTAGAYRAGLKLLITGRSKTGKSYFAASAPGPLLAMACGEPGIIPYLDPARGDVGLEVHTADDYYAAIDYAVKHEKDFATFISDNDNLAWTQTLEDFEDAKGGEIRGGDWKKIKGPRKAALRSLMRSKINVIFTCWLREIVYKQEEVAPGVQGKTELLPAELPEVEKNVPYAVDLIFLTDVKKDKLFRPTNIHTVTYMGGRRPRTVPPDELYTGRVWSFDSRKPVASVWDEVVKPFRDRWVEGGSEHLGLDPREAARAGGEMESAWQDQETGRMLALISQQTSLAMYQEVWRTSIEAPLNSLDEQHKQLVLQAHKAKKKELGG